MGAAYRCKEEFTPDGKRLVRRERVIGDNVIWGIVAVVVGLTAILSGAYLFLPASFWAFLKR